VERDDSPLFAQGAGGGGFGFGKYHFIAELARSGTAVVHLAVEQEHAFRRIVAVKELRTELLDDDAAVAAFLDGSRIAARLDHPNLVHTFEVGRYGFRRFQAMEYVDGSQLSEIIQRARRQGGPMPLPMLLRVLTDVLAALEYAHALADVDGTPLGLVHRDLGFHNVMMTYEGVVKILDFGFGAVKAPAGKAAASPARRDDAYPAPECFYGLAVDLRADLFAVGVMLWQGIVMRRSTHTKWHNLSGPDSIRADVDPKLFAIVERATNGDPAARYPTARAMRDEIEGYAKQSNLALPGARDLAEFVSPLLAKKREGQQAIIGTQLRPVPDSLAPTAAATPHAPPVADRESAPVTSRSAAPDLPAARAQGASTTVRRFALAAVCGAMVGVAIVMLSSRDDPQPPSASMAPPPVHWAGAAAPEQPATAEPSVEAPDPAEPITTSRAVHRAMTGAVRVAAKPSAPAPPLPVEALAPSAAAAPSTTVTSIAATPTPLSAIDAPATKPVRDIIKRDPYLQ
jgi:serine/threonine-protein kinase